MTVGVDDELRIREYPGDDTATPRAYGFKILDPDDLRVTRTNADGSETLLVRGTHYTVSGAGNPTGGDVTPLAPIAAGTSWRIEGDMALDQPTDYTAGDDFPAESHERGLDRAMIAAQEARRDINDVSQRSMLFPRGESAGSLPNAASRANKFLAFTAAGAVLLSSGTGADAGLRGELGSGDGQLVGYQADLPDAVWQDLRDRLMEEVSVKTFGAKTDGTDSLAAINKAIASAPVNGVLRFTAGTYHVSGPVVIDRDDLTIVGPGVVLKALDGSNFEYVLNAVDVDRVYIHDLTFDANQANRTAGQAVRFCGARFALSRDVGYYRCRAINAIGYDSIPGVGLIHSGCVRGNVSDCRALDCGGTSGTNAADGIYVSGDNMLISNCITENCTDTGQVLENCNNSGIVGGTTKNCNAAAAITNVTNFVKRGNYIKGLTVVDWNSSVTGGIQIGCPANTTGDLLDTEVDVIMQVATGGKGVGPAISVRKIGTGQAVRVRIRAMVNGASTQCILVNGQDVRIDSSLLLGSTNACVQFVTGATGEVTNSKLIGGSFGVLAQGTAALRVKGNSIIGNGTQSYGIFAFETSNIAAEANDIDGQTSFRTGKDVGATLNIWRFSGTTLEYNGLQLLRAPMTGWALDTGTAKRTANATYTNVTISNPPTQAEVQAISLALENVSRTVKAIKDDLHVTAGHGLFRN